MLGFPLGILSAAGAGGVAGDYELIESYILGSSQASVVFSNLGDYASTYKHLQIRGAAREDTGGLENIFVRFNGDSGANYRGHQLYGDGSSVVSGAQGAGDTFGFVTVTATASDTSNAFGGFVMDITDPFSSTKNTTTRTLGGVANRLILLRSALWINTASVTSITLLAQSGANFVSGSRFSIYGIR